MPCRYRSTEAATARVDVPCSAPAKQFGVFHLTKSLHVNCRGTSPNGVFHAAAAAAVVVVVVVVVVDDDDDDDDDVHLKVPRLLVFWFILKRSVTS
jgi:hypothetical protein